MATIASRTAARKRRPATPKVSLERALSKLGLASRSESRVLIEAGRVAIDGRTVTNPSLRVIPEQLAITIDGRSRPAAGRFTVILHKPRGYVTTRSDPEGRKTVYDLLADVPVRVVPVGRLDLATSGLLILTSDTQLADWLTDPRNQIPRVYLATVEGRVSRAELLRLTEGLMVDGERLAAIAAVLRKASARESHVTLTLGEGKNREVRRLFDAIHHPVTRLRRVRFGGLELADLAPGSWRQISDEELRAAFPAYQPRRREPRPK